MHTGDDFVRRPAGQTRHAIRPKTIWPKTNSQSDPDGDWFTVSEKVKQSLRCELDVSYGPGEREKYDIITSHSTLQGAISTDLSFAVHI